MEARIGRERTVKMVHAGGAAWFIASAGYLIVFGLRRAGTSWLVIASISGYSTVLAFLLVSLYLFAVYCGISRNQKAPTEHPLTTSVYYLVFYDVSPFLGALEGAFGAIGVNKPGHFLVVMAAGSLWATFVVWVIIDPAAGLLEMLLPASKANRRKRMAQTKAIREERQRANEKLLAEVLAETEAEQKRWQESLGEIAERLAVLAAEGDRESEAVDIGLAAWQMGGLGCMRQLHSMAKEVCREKYHEGQRGDHISIWWDGVGDWHSGLVPGEA